MTKNLKLTNDYMKDIFHGELNKGKKIHGKYHFFNYTLLTDSGLLSEGEGYKPSEVANDPSNVPIYNQIQIPIFDESQNIIGYEKHPDWGEIIRYEGSVENPIECYGCNCDEELTMPTSQADKWLAVKIVVRDSERMIGFEPNPNYNKIVSRNIFEEVI